MRNQIKDLTTQVSDWCRHNGNGFRNPFTECRTQRHQHLAQAHANQQVNRFKLDTPEFQSCLQPKEFMVVGKNRKFPHKKVPRKMAEIVPKEGAEIKHHSISQYIKDTCRQFQTICTTGGKGAKLIIDPRSHENIVLEALQKFSFLVMVIF
jgi:hypothetical protein